MRFSFLPPRAATVGRVAALLATVVVAIVVLRRAGTGTPALDRPIVAGLDFTVDSLPNGLRYYVHAQSGGGRAELRLVVDAGSVQEGEDQRGLAHAVEHMTFRGTRRFPGRAVDRYFDAIGMRRGEDVNATTGLDDTEYRMTVPTARAGALDSALAMLASMAHEALFDTADARREAGVLLEEWRSSRDLDTRVRDARHPVVYQGTPYVARAVIGDTAVLRRFDVGAMRRYYEAWYRPELMAVVAVGDFDPAEVEAIVRRHFGAIPSRSPRRARPVAPAGDTTSDATRAVVVADPEARRTRIDVWHAGPGQRYRVLGDFRAALVGTLWRDVLEGRLDDATLRADSPIAGAGVEYRWLARAMGADVVGVTAMTGQTLPALDAVAGELRALARGGPTSAELEERRAALLRSTEERAQDGDGNANLAREFVDHFLTGNAVLTTHATWEMTRDLLPTVTVEDVRDHARARTADGDAIVVIAATSDDSVARLPAASIIARARSVRGGTAARPADVSDVPRLLAEVPTTAGTIVSEREVPEARAYEWTLSNGLRLLLKPTAFSFDEVSLRAIAPGGASLAAEDDYASAYLADVVLGVTGVGPIPAPRLRRWLEASSISLSPTVTDDAIALEGSAAPRDVEALFQLVHLHLTAPRHDTVAFRRYQARMQAFLGDDARDPDAVFHDAVDEAFAAGDRRVLRRGAAFRLRTRLDDALAFWTRRAANGAGFTVVVVGDFTLASMRPLARRYLASIPRGAAEQPRDRGIPLVAGSVRRALEAGVGPRARTSIGFTRAVAITNENVNALGMVRDVLDRALEERLREQMGGTYGADVSLDLEVAPPTRYRMTIEFESDPERQEALAAAALDELARIHRDGPTAAEFEGARAARVRDFDGRMEENSYWLSELAFHARHGWPLATIAAHPAEAEATSLEEVRRACAAYIPARDFVHVTMRPRTTGVHAQSAR